MFLDFNRCSQNIYPLFLYWNHALCLSVRPIVLLVRESLYPFDFAHLFSGAYEYLMKKSDGRNTDVSRLFIYYNSRARNNKSRHLTDSGCSMTSAIEALEEFGTCLETIWPYDISKVNSRPSDRAFHEARNHTITEALQVQIDLNEMKSCLAQGFPFAFGLRLFKSFDKASRGGAVPPPNSSDRMRSSHGRSLYFFLHHDNQPLFVFF